MTSAGASRLRLLATAALFSTGGAAIKACALTSWQVASFRSGIACLALLVFVRESRRMPTWRELLVGVGYAATLICFVCATKLTTAANAIFLQSTAPIYILFLAPLCLHERLSRRDVVFLACVGVGVVGFFIDEQRPIDSAPDPALGNIIALVSGASWALTVVGMRWLAARKVRASDDADATGGLGAVVAGNFLAFALCLVPALRAPIPSGAMPFVVITYLGVFQIGLAYALLVTALRHVRALEASVLLLVEPVLNPVWAFLVNGERPGAWALAGGVVIIASTAMKTWWDGRAEAASAVA